MVGWRGWILSQRYFGKTHRRSRSPDGRDRQSTDKSRRVDKLEIVKDGGYLPQHRISSEAGRSRSETTNTA